MPLQPDVEFMLGQLAALGHAAFSTQTPEQARARMAQLGVMSAQILGPPSPDVSAEDRRIPTATGEIPVRIYTPTGKAPGAAPGLVFFHGGGWVVGNIESYDRECRAIAQQAECVVVSVDYRLAPEHKFPAAVDDCVLATRWTAAHAAELGIDAARLAVGGDSAGGNLAAVVAQQLRDTPATDVPGAPPLICQLLIYPATDSVAEYPSQHEPDVGLLHQADVRWFMGHYLADPADCRDPRFSPLRASSLAGLPRAIVALAEYDPLRDQGAAYAEALRAAGVPTELQLFKGHIHGFMSLAAAVPSAGAAQAEMLRALRRVLHGA
jgi:acetyl esterase